jgi:hypothetical protein
LDLIITSSDVRVDKLIDERFLVLPNIKKSLKILPCWKSMDSLRWRFTNIPKVDLVTIGVEAER